MAIDKPCSMPRAPRSPPGARPSPSGPSFTRASAEAAARRHPALDDEPARAHRRRDGHRQDEDA